MRPWRVKQWIIPKAGSDFVCSMEAVLAVYEREYNVQNPVVCLDESPHQLISEVRSRQQDEKGVVYEDYEYKREGVADIYMITEPKGGRRDVLEFDS